MKKILLFAAAAILANASKTAAQDARDVITFEYGSLQVSVLSEGQSSGKIGTLIGATPDQLQRYAPDGTYPSATNVFLVRAKDGPTVLIDAGYGRKLFDNLKSLDVAPEQVDAVLLTHMHGDHIGGLLRDGKAAFPAASLLIAKAEHDYWTSAAEMEAVPANRRGGFVAAQKAIEVYKARLVLFTPGELDATKCDSMMIPEVTIYPQPNTYIKAIASYGHTPGHTAYLLESGEAKLLVWGDLTHAMAIQVPCPEVAMTYDVNPTKAVETRKKIFDYLFQNKIAAGGMHVAFPAIGTLKEGKTGAREWKAICDCEGY
ncbi:MAG: MBL fold metallo-hydrolase [Prevotellaceae bacterium]|jgi:glyoxylase-like metal-dependent hydrolase (beta-lactamase superfamily II)|nr:MBL fold metallo-hydrolase [Prevotellaceae bacterium]